MQGLLDRARTVALNESGADDEAGGDGGKGVGNLCRMPGCNGYTTGKGGCNHAFTVVCGETFTVNGVSHKCRNAHARAGPRGWTCEEAEAEAVRQKLTAKTSFGHRGLTAAFMYSAAEFKNLGK